MKTLIKVAAIIFGGIFSNIHAWGGDGLLSDGVGAERIASQPRSYSFQTTIHSALGTSHTVSNFGVYNESVSRGDFFSVGTNEYPTEADSPFGGRAARTFTNDIRRSQTDKEQFDMYLDEKDYAAAWHMGLENDQGRLWKRRAIARAKTEIISLIEQGVFKHKDSLLIQSFRIVNDFRSSASGLELAAAYETLRTLHNSTYEAAVKEREEFMQKPEILALSEALQSELIDRLFGER
jgi:hypothetical protein